MMGVTLTPLKQIETVGGAVYHGLRAGDDGFAGYGEAYFSTVDKGAIKGWKLHRRMVMNLIVPVGFVVHDERSGPPGEYAVYDLSSRPEAYARLTVGASLWMAFTGLEEGMNMILNLASIIHDPEEADRRDVNLSTWRWS